LRIDVGFKVTGFSLSLGLGHLMVSKETDSEISPIEFLGKLA